ncbi:hypothetical protein RKD48_005610 [Streptomyces ambofaciens]
MCCISGSRAWEYRSSGMVTDRTPIRSPRMVTGKCTVTACSSGWASTYGSWDPNARPCGLSWIITGSVLNGTVSTACSDLKP